MWQRDYEGQCGNCSEYTFEGDNNKGYCRRWGAYYYPDDTCSKQREGSSGPDCFLTTACCEERGLPDDCYELTMLRKYRDEVLKESEKGRELIKFYYAEAPRIVEQINASEKRKEIYNWIYEQITKLIKDIEDGSHEYNMLDYLFMMYQADLYSQRNDK